MVNTVVARFYLFLMLFVFSDLVLLLSNIWNSLKVTSSPLFMGLTMATGAAIPFILQKVRLFNGGEFVSVNGVCKRRIGIFACLLLLSLAGYSDTMLGFMLVSISLGYMLLIIMSAFEANNAKLVIGGFISSNNAARVMQTVIQTGAFFGALVSGYLLTRYNYNHIIAGLCIFDITISLCALYFGKDYEETNNAAVVDGDPNAELPKKLKHLCLGMGFIGLQICAFTSLVPIAFQNVKELSADYYGLCSAAAGVGSFLAAFVNIDKFKFLFPAFVLVLADFLFMQAGTPILAVAVCFFIGFAMNTVRINLRKDMIDHTRNGYEADKVAKLTAALHVFSQPVGPLFFGLLASSFIFGAEAAAYLFPLAGFGVFAFVLSLSRRAR